MSTSKITKNMRTVLRHIGNGRGAYFDASNQRARTRTLSMLAGRGLLTSNPKFGTLYLTEDGRAEALEEFNHAQIERAHDVRTLRPCKCGGLGHRHQMVEIKVDGPKTVQWWHGRCYIEVFGPAKFLELPKEQIDKMTIGDIGPDTMRAVINNRSLINS